MKTYSIIEDQETIRTNVITFLEARSSFKLSFYADSAEDFLNKLSFNPAPEMILLDIGLPGISGVEAIPLIKEKLPSVDIIMLTTYEEDDIIFAALSAGACSYISKRTSLAKIVDAMNIVSAGGSYMSPSIAKKVIANFNKQKTTVAVQLSSRQKEIVKYLSEGKTYRGIAEFCDISINTVRTHIKRIYEQLEINNKTSLIQKYRDGEIK